MRRMDGSQQGASHGWRGPGGLGKAAGQLAEGWGVPRPLTLPRALNRMGQGRRTSSVLYYGDSVCPLLTDHTAEN